MPGVQILVGRESTFGMTHSLIFSWSWGSRIGGSNRIRGGIRGEASNGKAAHGGDEQPGRVIPIVACEHSRPSVAPSSSSETRSPLGAIGRLLRQNSQNQLAAGHHRVERPASSSPSLRIHRVLSRGQNASSALQGHPAWPSHGTARRTTDRCSRAPPGRRAAPPLFLARSGVTGTQRTSTRGHVRVSVFTAPSLATRSPAFLPVPASRSASRTRVRTT